MNKRIYFTFGFLIFLFSCVKDKGNYVYTEIKDLQISDINSSVVKDFDSIPLIINPTVNDGSGNPIIDSNYTFEWGSYSSANSSGTVQVFGNSKNLNIVVTKDSAFGQSGMGTYGCYYRVTNKKTGIYADFKFSLLLGSLIYEGWLALCEKKDGNSRLDMISLIGGTKDSVINDVLKFTNSTFPLNSPPVSITYAYAYFNDATLGDATPLIITEKNAAYLTSDSFKYNPSYEIQNNSNFIFHDYKGLNVSNSQLYQGLISYAGNLLPIRSVYDFNISKIDYPVNIYNNVTFKASNFIASPHATLRQPYIIYDENIHSFLRFADITWGKTCVALPEGSLFKYQDSSKELIYMNYTDYDGGSVVAVLKDIQAGDLYLARFTLTGVQKFYSKINIMDPKIIDKMAFDPTYGYLIYSTIDNKIMEYDPTDQSSIQVADMGSEKVSLLQYYVFDYYSTGMATDFQASIQNKLIVGSYNEADQDYSGNFYLYTVPGLHAQLEVSKHLSGLGKIVSVAYRYH